MTCIHLHTQSESYVRCNDCGLVLCEPVRLRAEIQELQDQNRCKTVIAAELQADLQDARQAGTPYARQQHDLNALTIALQALETKHADTVEHAALMMVALEDVRYERNCLREDAENHRLKHLELIGMLRKTLPVLDHTAREIAGSPDATSGLASFIRARIGTGQHEDP